VEDAASLTIYAAVARVQKQKHVVHNVKDAARLVTVAKFGNALRFRTFATTCRAS